MMVTVRRRLAPQLSANERLVHVFARCLLRALLRKNTFMLWALLLVLVYVQFIPSPTYNNLVANINTKTNNKGNNIGSSHSDNAEDIPYEDGIAACLLVMDDNHFLVEWIAYHYHTANLRKLVVAVDPKSQSLPLEILGRWKDKIDITVWTENEDYMPLKLFEDTKEIVAKTFSEHTPSLVEHRARQRLFYWKCLRKIKREADEKNSKNKSTWTILLDVDEFVRVNYNNAKSRIENSTESTIIEPIAKPGSVASALDLLALPPVGNETTFPWDWLRSSPCIPLPRIRYVPSKNYNNNNPFVTHSHLEHTRLDDIRHNKISKVAIDLSRVSLDEIVVVNSIHMPIRKYCSQRNRHYKPNDALLVVNHYLGSYPEFSYREHDSRSGIDSSKVNVRDKEHYEKLLNFGYTPITDDGIKPWLGGFLSEHPEDQEILLKDSGKLAPKSWKTTLNNTDDNDRCALLFFGLPRSFGDMVLPSITRNILEPNARHNCDVYVHYYRQEREAKGRRNEGGKINADDIFLLQESVVSASKEYHEREYAVLPEESRPAYNEPMVVFAHDTPEDFDKQRKEVLEQYHTEKIIHNGKEMLKYYPWDNKSYHKSSIDNMVKQWHSIQSAFLLMDYTAKQKGISYSRVGMFRSDVLYVTPIDIASLGGNSYDTSNQKFVVPNFANYPVNDRMVYGPYDAVKIWATQRFALMEVRGNEQPEPGNIMHSERFLQDSVFVAMEKKFGRVSSKEICFLRARAGSMALLDDCSANTSINNHVWASRPASEEIVKQRVDRVAELVGKSCLKRNTKVKPVVRVVECV